MTEDEKFIRGNERVLQLVRELLENFHGDGDPRADTRAAVLRAMEQISAESLVGSLANYVTMLAIIYEPGDPSRAVDRLEAFMRAAATGEVSPELLESLTGGDTPLGELGVRIRKLEERVARREAGGGTGAS